MRWPLVSRRRYDELARQLAAEIRDAECGRRMSEARERAQEDRHHETVARVMALHDREVGRVDVLTKFLMRMKAQGAVLLPDGAVQATRVAHQPKQMTPIEQAIDDNPRARASVPLRKRLNTYAEQAKREGKDEDAIIETLRTWGQVTHDDDTDESAFD